MRTGLAPSCKLVLITQAGRVTSVLDRKQPTRTRSVYHANLETPRSRERFSRFLKKLVDLDKKDVLFELLWQEFSGSIRILLDNPKTLWGSASYPVVDAD